MFRPHHQAISLKLRKLYNVWHKIRTLKFSNIQRDLVFVSCTKLAINILCLKLVLFEISVKSLISIL